MDTKILDNLIRQFNTDNLVSLFRQKTRNFRLLNENWPQYDQQIFTDCTLVGEFKTTTDDLEMLVFTARTNSDLSERSGKKSQYDLGKKILKEQLRYAGGFFVFFDNNGNFRFSLIYDIPQADGSRQYSNFRRYTYFVSKEQTNKTFKQQISEADFSSLDKIIEAFSVDKVRKEFYTEIATWYFWAMDKIKFPDDYKYSDDPAKDAEIRNSTNLIRLITRIIFIWFLKEKNLVPNTLFDPEKLKNIVKDFYTSNQTANYYNAILQNLFFGTLNQQMNERKFAKDAGFNENRLEFGVKNLYRYTDKFTIPENEAIALFKDIPFLNGGLFDCLDKDSVYIDGFSRNPKKQAIVFDYLFFQGREEKVNLSQYDMGKDKRVRGLFEILKSYNFTIDESTPIDQEVALDPELLGKVFEELLASYNPETASTARKATGSYYTPREIVDYMVQQSLKQYFTTHTQLSEETIDQLLSYSDSLPELTDDQRKQIIALIDNIKILDPACGSGAFPMGILHQLVFLLQKLDPDNKLWHELQYQKALQATQEAFKHTDKQEREELLKEISESFDESINHPDYARKLYLIENCIYGVDIQPVAIQISKLRFFISLVLDQKIDARKENYGIRPLPNLETKFVAANTLIGLELLTTDLFSENNPIKILQDQLKATRHAYFNAKMRKEKLKLIQQEKELRKKIAEHVSDTLIHKNEEEIKNLEKCLAEARKKLDQIEKEPEQKKTIKTVNIFGDIETTVIDIKKKKIKAQKSQISFIAKQINTLKAANTKDAIQKVAQQISTFDQYDQNASTDWYDPEWMFGVTEGFDIVIGNPPYISTKGIDAENKKQLEKNFGFADDAYNHFFFKAIQLLKENGLLTFITSKTYWTIQTKKNLRELLLKNTILQIFDTANPFENAMVDTGVIIVKKATPQPTHEVVFLDGKTSITQPQKYTIQQNDYANAPNKVIFIPTDFNKKIYQLLGKKVNKLLSQWWDKISTSKNIEKHDGELEDYRNSLNPGDITLLGLITEGGQGLATANNGKYIGVLEGTKWADNVREQRPEKLLLATQFCKTKNIKNKADAQTFLHNLSEKEIRQLFDDLKEQYGRDVFGQGWLYRIVSPDEIADVDTLTNHEKLNGITGKKTFVPYDKGDKDGNRWYAPTAYYIDWSRENVKFLKENSGKKGEGMPVVRNPQFYFREGFCWTDVSYAIRCRIKEISIHDVLSMSLFPNLSLINSKFIVSLLNSDFMTVYLNAFVNTTVHFQINDARQLPIIIPTPEQLKEFEGIFNRAVEVQKQKFAGKLSEQEAEAKLEEIQRELDERVLEMYGLK